MKNLGFFSLLLLLVFSACRKDTDIIEVTTEVPNPEIIDAWQPRVDLVTGDLTGFVTDENKAPLAGASVKLNGNTAVTDDFGHFFFTDVQMNAKGAYLTVEKEGYFKGSRRFFPQAETRSRVAVNLLPLVFTSEFEASTGGAHEFATEGVTLTFPPDAIRTETGAAYSGTVRVAAHYLDPNSDDIYTQMPGNLQGINELSAEVALKTLGMMAVELQGNNGESLNIAEGKTAVISVPAPDADNLPAEVPLWSFNEEVGMWVKESTATLTDGVYTGEVSHFSFWNWDIPAPFADFGVTLQFSNGNPVIGHVVLLLSESFGTGYGITNAEGYTGGMVPVGETLTLQVLDNCSNPAYETEIGPFTEGENADLGIITIDLSAVSYTQFSGTVTDCDAAPVANSLVKLVYPAGPEEYYYTDETGSFDVNIISCSDAATANLTAIDLNNFVGSDDTPVVIGATNELGNIAACDNVVEENIVSLTIDGETRAYLATTVDVSPAGGVTIGVNADSISIYFGFFGNTVGDYSGPQQNYLEGIFDYNQEPFWEYVAGDFAQGQWQNFEVTVYTEENISGNFSGDVVNISTGNTIFAEGTFSVAPE